MVQAVLGAEISIETIHGKEKIKIPAGTQDGKVFKLSGKGVQRMGATSHGDHLVKISIEIPEKIIQKRKRTLWGIGNRS